MKIGIFGATGMVGREIVGVLSDRNFPLDSFELYASDRSAGKAEQTPWGSIVLKNADQADFKDIDIAFFAISGDWSKKFAAAAVEAGCIVIDNSSAFRYDENIPLVVPEINSHAIGKNRLIANPNCTTAIAAIPLSVIHGKYGLKKVILSTYQATSGAGNGGMKELADNTAASMAGEPFECKVFKHPIAFNIIPQIDEFQPNGYTREEMKVTWETHKILGDSRIAISCTAVRVPTMRAHAEAITVETESPVTAEGFRAELSGVDGVVIKDNPANFEYPMPLTATGRIPVEVGRIRQSLVFGSHGLDFFVCGDQLLRGAALNAVLIAEKVAEKL